MKEEITETLISFKVAKLAKKKGFNIFTGKAYIDKGNQELFFTPSYTGITSGIEYHVPTQSLLQKWLREIHSIHITIFSKSQESWMYRITAKGQSLEEGLYGEDFENYEEALEAGSQEALKLIKDETNNN